MIEQSPRPVRGEPGSPRRKPWSTFHRIKASLSENWKRCAWTCVVASVGLASYAYVSTPPSVNVVVARTITASETLGATGKVRGERATDLGLDVSGVIRGIYVHEGDRVARGQLLLSLDRSEMDAQVQGAMDRVRSAEAELARVNRGPLGSEIARARAELSQARLVGDARVAKAKARLSELSAGARSQEISEAQIELQRRQKALAKAQTDLKRTQSLVNQGALAQTALEQAQMDVDSATADVNVQRERLSLLRAGATSGELAEARAAVAEAIASRDTSVRAAQEGLNTLLSTPRREDVAAARARVDEARSELRRLQDMRSKTDLRAPFDGVVAGIPVEQGQSVSPGQRLMVLHEMARPMITVETGEENLRVLRVGQTAIISSDAYPGRTFDAVLSDLGSNVNPDRGTIEIKLRPLREVGWLRPDMTVDVNVITKRGVKRMVVPPGAVTKFGGQSCVLVARDGVAKPVRVTTGGAGPSGLAVDGDIKDGEMIVRDAAGVTPNSDIRVARE